jgi:DNA-binding XRE family transcriptional regulator
MSSNDRGSGRVFTLEQNERAREKLKQLLESRYDGNQSDLAKALNVSQTTSKRAKKAEQNRMR